MIKCLNVPQENGRGIKIRILGDISLPLICLSCSNIMQRGTEASHLIREANPVIKKQLSASFAISLSEMKAYCLLVETRRK